MAAAKGCSISCASEAPARRQASVTARLSTGVIADGTQITTLGLLNRLTPALLRISRTILCVMSKSVMAPFLNGRCATI